MTTRSILPKIDGDGDIGSASRLWRTIYCNRVTFADGTYMESATDIAGSAAITQNFDSGWIDIYQYNPASPTSNVYSGLHTLGGYPKFCMVRIKRVRNGVASPTLYDNNDEIMMGETWMTSNMNYTAGFAIKFDATNYWFRTARGYPAYTMNKQGSGDNYIGDSTDDGAITDYQFKIVLYK